MISLTQVPGPGPMDGERRICGKTGLALVRATGQTATRIAKFSHGPMNPLVRNGGEDPGGWGRYDVAGHRTIYAASPSEGAYAESLAVLRPAPSLATKISDLFDDDAPDGNQSLEELVRDDWDNQFHTVPGFLPAGWRQERLEYQLTLPGDGWIVGIEHGDSIAAISRAIGGPLSATIGRHHHLTVGDLRGENRQTTTSIARWIHAQVLDDGSLPHGIVYGSKHGSNWSCWAIWLRIVDDGDDPSTDVQREPTRAAPGSRILSCDQNDSLRTIVDLFGLRCY